MMWSDEETDTGSKIDVFTKGNMVKDHLEICAVFGHFFLFQFSKYELSVKVES